MQTKSERFEMRLDQQTLDRVDEWRAGQSDVPSRAEAIRRLVDKGLADGRADGDQTVFSGAEKLIVSMLCEMHPAFKGGPELDPLFIRDALLGGHNWGLKWQYRGIFEGYQDDEEIVREVVDILDMWSFLEHGYDNLKDEDKERIKKEADPFGAHVRFEGFDGNYETNYMGIARFLVEKMDRFETFKKRSFNSHAPSVDAYRRMLTAFLPIRSGLTGGRMSTNQIIAVLKERTHPEYRK